MSVSAKGDLGKLRRVVEKLADKSALRDINAALAEEGLELVAQGFETGQDPTGRPWPLSQQGGAILRDKARLARSFTQKATATGFRIGTNVVYAKTHQEGATIVPKKAKALAFQVREIGMARRPGKNGNKRKKHWVFTKKVVIPARPMLPEGDLSPKWERALAEAAGEVLAELVKP